VVRIYFADEAELNTLGSGLDVWEVHHSPDPADRYIVARLAPSQMAALQQAGYRLEIDPVRTAQLDLRPFAAGQQTGIPGYACYRTVEETYASLAQLAVTHPSLATWRDIGDSWNKTHPEHGPGYDLHVLVLTNGAIPGPKPILFMVGAVHARELTTTETAARFAEQLIAGYGVDPDITWLLDYHEVQILPIANPDGRKEAEQLVYWRKNTNRNDGCVNKSPFISYYGVDLNRNHSFKWNQCEGVNCSTSAACRDTFRGSAPASEPETQAIQNYLTSIYADRRGPGDDDAAPADTSGMLITLHSYSRLVLFPWGWRSTPSPNHTALQTLGHKFGYFTGYKVCQGGAAGCLYMTDGTTDDWFYGELGAPGYTFELGTAFFEECSYFEETILNEVLPALRYAAKAARRPYQTPAGPEALQMTVTPTRVLSGTQVTLRALLDDTRYAGYNFIDEPTQPISAAHFTVDTPSWITGTARFALGAADGSFDTPQEVVQATVDTTGWSIGRHLLLVEGQDAAGNWGVPSAVFVEITDTPYGVAVNPPTQTITAVVSLPLTVTLDVQNVGFVTDTFTITVTSAWPVSAPVQRGPIAAGGTAPLPLVVTPPAATPLGTTNIVTVQVTSQTAPAQQQTAQVAVRIAGETLFLPWIARR
jgi:hypothetical protein